MVAALSPHSDEHPDTVIARICDELVTPENKLSVKAVIGRYQTWLIGHPRVVVAQSASVAQTQVRSFFTRHQPKVGKHGQLSMYFPEDWVAIGNGQRARMRDVTAAQLVLWESEIDKAHGSTVTVYESKKAYIKERRDKFGTHGTLDALERAEFGYVDLDVSYDQDGDDEGDDE